MVIRAKQMRQAGRCIDKFRGLIRIYVRKKWINQYKLISVREESAINILEKQYGFESATRIIDPTLCLDADYWRKRESTKYNFKDYILIYNLNRSKDFDNYAKKISKKNIQCQVQYILILKLLSNQGKKE